MARRKQLRKGLSNKSSSNSSSASPPYSRPAPPTTTPPATADTAGASHSPGKALSAAPSDPPWASLRQSSTALDKQALSHAAPAAAAHAPASAETTASGGLQGPVHAQAHTLPTSLNDAIINGAAAATPDAPQPNHTCLHSAEFSISGHPAATESSALKGPAGAPSDAELTRSHQRSAQCEDQTVLQPTAVDQPISASGSRLPTCTGQPVTSCQPSVVMTILASQQQGGVPVGCAGTVSAAKPHPRTAVAKPGRHQGVVLSPQADAPQHTAKTVMSHRLDFSECIDDDAGNWI